MLHIWECSAYFCCLKLQLWYNQYKDQCISLKAHQQPYLVLKARQMNISVNETLVCVTESYSLLTQTFITHARNGEIS